MLLALLTQMRSDRCRVREGGMEADAPSVTAISNTDSIKSPLRVLPWRRIVSACRHAFEHMQYFWIAVDPGRCCKSIVSVVQHARASIVSPAPNCLSPRQAKPISPYRHWGACKWAAGLASEGTCRVSELTKLRISTLVRLLSHRNREQTDAAKDMSVCLVKDPRSSDSCTRRERALYFDMLQSMRHG